MDILYDIRKLIERIYEQRNRIKGQEQIIASVIAGQTVQNLPLFIMNPRNRAVPGTKYSMKEQFYDPLKMLYSQLEDILLNINPYTTAPLCVRPNYGTIFIPAMLGMQYKVLEDNYPWMIGHLSRSEFASIDKVNPIESDIMQRTNECIQTFMRVLPDWIHIYLPDTQGPFDIAHLIYGNDIFYDIIDDPQFVHELMDYSTQLYIDVTVQLKKILGEPMDQCFHGHAMAQGIFIKNGGVRVSEDTPTLLSPTQIDEFVLPYDQKALEKFGGGFIHFCGKNDYLLKSFFSMDQVRVLNLGNPELFNPEEVMDHALRSTTTYFGPWPRREDENLEQYMSRMKSLSDNGTRGLLLLLYLNMFPDQSIDDVLQSWTA